MALIEIKIVGRDSSGEALDGVAEKVRKVGDESKESQSKMSGFFSFMGGAATGGVVALGGALVGAATMGLSFNNSMEQASAKINAFTKDAGTTKKILNDVATEAAKTPFAFEEMANATAALGPVAKSSGVELMDLVKQAEILAASNPAEGLTGAAFSLKEAMSGDFTSAIERFNLSRSYLKELKDQGVPAMQALSMAMKQAGYDSDLVSSMANTAEGRWSTFMDTWTTLAGLVTQPIFDAVSGGLGGVNDALAAAAPMMTEFATALAGQVSGAIQTITGLFQAFQVGAEDGFVGGLANMIYSLDTVSPAFSALGDAVITVGGFIEANWMPIVTAAATIIGVGLAGAIAGAIAAMAAVIAAAAPLIAILAAIGAAGAALQAAWSSDFGGIQELTRQAMAAVQQVVQQVLGVVQTFWQQNGAQIMAFTQQTWATIQQIVGTVAQILAVLVKTVFGGIATFISQHGAEIQRVLQTAWAAIQSIIQLALNTIQGITTTVLGVLTGDWGKAADGIKQVVGGLGTFLQGAWDGIRNTVVELGPKVLDAALSVGRGIMDGIKKGIMDAVGGIIDAAVSAVRSAVDAAKRAVGIHSPSTVFAQSVGLPIAQGMALGIAQGAPLVATAASDAAAGSVAAAQQASDGAKTVNVGGITINQTPGQRGDQVADEAIGKLRLAAEMRR